jgi:hypothetical protein
LNSGRLETTLPPGHRDQGREVPGANHEGYAEAVMVDPTAAPPAVQPDPGTPPDEDTATETTDDGITTLPPAPGFPD